MNRDAGSAVDAGRLVIALGALALLVSLFLDWYGAGRFDATITAWTSFEVVDMLLAALSIAVLCAVAEGIALPDHEPRMPPALLWFAGPFALVLVLVAIINLPPLVSGVDPTLEAGIWVALGGALVMTIGVAVSTLRVSVVVGGRERSPRVDPRAETRTMTTEPATHEPPTGPGPDEPLGRDPRIPPPR